ncbi:uncharacterized protein LOC132624727 [Lycium barbarum]|uniref:uncharacterized protein LOC132624727 n=1 Tax=Lycium barbarum TaxID=112863 RepID=UPI00293EB657|nr:uncharacterized protein LOC132624727 [Lycium barbarum]
MMNALIWNIRSVNTMEAFTRLIKLNQRYHFGFIGLMEPFQDSDKIEEYRRRLGMEHAIANISGKIWAFVEDIFDYYIMVDHQQHLTIKLRVRGSQEDMLVSLLYAKCTQAERLELWDSLKDLSTSVDIPWMIGGDFNAITSEHENFGGLPVTINEIQDFRSCIHNCGISDLGFSGSKFTWWNGQSGDDCIFERLDRCMGNQLLQAKYSSVGIKHLIRSGSDHAPMLISYTGDNRSIKKPFKFLNFWVKQEGFIELIKQNWTADFLANPFILFHHKLQKVKAALSQWSKATFGNIFQEIEALEEIIKAELNRYLHLEEEFWKQKAGVQWFQDGDRNTKKIHAYVQGRRKRMQIRRIQREDGNWIEEEGGIIVEAIRFYTAQFTKEEDPKDFEILNHLPRMVFEEDNLWFEAEPTKEEVKAVVFQLNGESAGGSDGFTGVFYQACWEIIGEDVTNMVKAFFCGVELPKFVTHTNLVLLPKKEMVNTFSDMRPISLSNFVNKIFSRLIHERLVSKLSDIISLNQSGFVKDRSIVENILLTQEIVSDIRLRTKDANVIIKLDMEKAYDRVSWLFLTKVLRQMGFSEKMIDMVYRIVNNNWYSVLVNGQQQGFFQSTRGVKKGDPLSPTLFILAGEVLTRSLNALHQNIQFKGFGMPKWSPKVNHLAYADDMIIFTSADVVSLQKIMGILKNYEQTSGQKINMDKSVVCMHNNVPGDISITVEIVTGINRKEFPFMYLGCPIYHCRRKKEFFNSLILKIMNRLQGWKGKMLSFGGRAIFIKHVLQSMPIHMLSAFNPPSGIIRQIHKMFAQFFWSNTIGCKSRHWVAWNNLCVPTTEGSLGFRSFHDVSLALFCKLWWNFRTKTTLWSAYMTNKYCRKDHAIVVQWKQGSQTWKRMLEARDLIEHQIWWQVRKGDSQFWFDNWIGLGALYYVNPGNTYDERIQNVKEMVVQGRWNRGKLMEVLFEDIVDHIMENITPPREEREFDRPWWILDTSGEFTIKSTWDFIRLRGPQLDSYRFMWIKGLPFEISFFLWRCWKYKIPTDDVLKKMNINLVSKCWCCISPREETMHHLFLTSDTSKRTWSFFCNAAGISMEGMQLQQLIVNWWKAPVTNRLKQIYAAVPSIIMWELWKRRNGIKHGHRKVNSSVIYLVLISIQRLLLCRNPSIRNIPAGWKDLIQMLEGGKARVKVTQVRWNLPPLGWCACNTDGASRGNPERSAYDFCLRDAEGNLIYAQTEEIGYATNVEAEIVALLEALKYCWVEEVEEYKRDLDVIFNHTLREANKLADALANFALDEGPLQYYLFEELNLQMRRILNSDKSLCYRTKQYRGSGNCCVLHLSNNKSVTGHQYKHKRYTNDREQIEMVWVYFVVLVPNGTQSKGCTLHLFVSMSREGISCNEIHRPQQSEKSQYRTNTYIQGKASVIQIQQVQRRGRVHNQILSHDLYQIDLMDALFVVLASYDAQSSGQKLNLYKYKPWLEGDLQQIQIHRTNQVGNQIDSTKLTGEMKFRSSS